MIDQSIRPSLLLPNHVRQYLRISMEENLKEFQGGGQIRPSLSTYKITTLLVLVIKVYIIDHVCEA